LEDPVGPVRDRLEPQAVLERSVHDQWRACDDVTLEAIDLGSLGQFELQDFADCSRLAADRDDLALFDLLHEQLAQ
jgi:hypothetical protein